MKLATVYFDAQRMYPGGGLMGLLTEPDYELVWCEGTIGVRRGAGPWRYYFPGPKDWIEKPSADVRDLGDPASGQAGAAEADQVISQPAATPEPEPIQAQTESGGVWKRKKRRP